MFWLDFLMVTIGFTGKSVDSFVVTLESQDTNSQEPFFFLKSNYEIVSSI